jgi:hypothetical protein
MRGPFLTSSSSLSCPSCAQVWLAFCKWIVERFDKGKGVTIINFIRLSWQHDELEQEIYGTSADRALRPVWRLSESFERAYCLEVPRTSLCLPFASLSVSMDSCLVKCNICASAVQEQR